MKKTAKDVAKTILENEEPKNPARHLALRLRARHKDFRHRAFKHDDNDDLSIPGKGHDHFIYHKNDQDGNDSIHIRNAEKPGHVHYGEYSGQGGYESHHDHPEGVHHEKAFEELKSKAS